jgi:hypothetical protein
MSNTCTQSALTALLRDVDSLEGYKNILYDQQNTFLGQVNGFDLQTLSTNAQVENDILQLNTTAVGCDSGDFPAVNDFQNICINRYLGNLLNKKDGASGDMTGFMDTLLSIAEKPLTVGLQALFALFEKFGLSSLINALDTNLTCITNADDVGRYTADIQAANDRIDAVVKDLAIDDQGEFSFDKLTAGIDTGLKDNLKTVYDKAQVVTEQSKANIDDKINSAGNMLPDNFF